MIRDLDVSWSESFFKSNRSTAPAVSPTCNEQFADTTLSGGRKRHKVLVFPCFRDRLACDPMNYFCVYANHEFKLRDSVTEVEKSIRTLIDEMVEAATFAFEEAMEHWRKLPLSVQRLHALRAFMTLPLSPPILPSLHAGGASHHMSRRSVDALASRSSSTHPQNNVPWNARHGQATPTPLRGVHLECQEEEDTILNSLLQQWDPPHNGPRCRIVLDIIASRKTLGDDPINSEPHRLGEKVFEYTQTKHHVTVVSTFVGISDSNALLVGRDILYPYRANGSNGTKKGIAKDFVRVSAPSSRQGTSPIDVALSFANTIGTLAINNTTSILSNLDNVLANTIPVPRMVLSPPANTDKVDNVRLVVCTPSARNYV